MFRFTLWVIEMAFWWTNLKQRELRVNVGKRKLMAGLLPNEPGTWEDKLQAQMEKMAKEEFGIEIDGNTAFLVSYTACGTGADGRDECPASGCPDGSSCRGR